MHRFIRHCWLALVLGSLSATLGAAPVIFTGPKRQGVKKDGVVKDQWGVEQTMMFEDGMFKSWYHGAPDSGGDYWNNPVIRYATSPDGKSWTDQGVCIGNTPYFRACPYTYHLMSSTAAGEPAGYYMPVGRNGQFGFDLFFSTTGLPGSWTQLNNGNLIIPLGAAGSGAWDECRSGNICIWYEANQWQVMYEGADVPPSQSGHGSQWFSWRVGRAYGASLTTLTKHPGNPVLSSTTFPYGAENCTGGTEVHKVGDTYYSIIHETDPKSHHSLTPTSCSLYKSTDLNTWTWVGWLSRIWVNKTADAQVADGSLLSVNGKTYFWYEDQPDQTALLPSLSLMTWDMPFEELVNHPEMLDDTGADGWSFEAGYGEVPTSSGAFPTTYFRKLSAPISPHCVVLAADATHQLRVRRAVGSVESQFAFSARAEQTNKKFIPLRLDANASNTVLAGTYFDTDGMIKYYNGAGIATAPAYTAATSYKFVYDLTPSGYSLTINDTLIAANIAYASPYVVPAYYKIEQSAGATGYVGVVMVAPTWNGGGADNNWSTPQNWNVIPSDGDSITFAGTTRPSSTNNTLAAVGGVTFANGGFTASGNPVALAGSVTSTGDNAWNINSTPSGNFSLTSNAGTLTVGGNLPAPGCQLTKSGAGTVSFSNSSVQLNHLNLNAGTLAVDGANVQCSITTGGWGLWLLNSAAILNVTNNGTLDVTQGMQIQQGTVNVSSGSVTVNSVEYSELYLGNSTSTAALNISGGSVTARVMSFGNGGSAATLNLTGGELAWKLSPYKGTGTAALNMGGGTLRADGSLTVPSNLPFNLTGINGDFTVNSQANPVTFGNVLSGSGGLTKTGTGTLTLGANNTYTGNTLVSNGTLALSQPYLADSSAVTIATGAVLNLAHYSNDTIAALTLGGIAQGPGTYNATTQPAFFSGSGSLVVIPGPYDTWINGFYPGQSAAAVIGRNADPDGDGVSNLIEFLTGGNPASVSDHGRLWVGTNGQRLVLSLAIRGETTVFSGSPSPTATVDGVSATIQGSADLGGFASPVSATPFVLPPGWSAAAPAGYGYRSFQLDGAAGLTNKGFLRLQSR
ncbi:MAG: autotransporter-associated beta strand repeat-containing protein [Verrucomicrobia bacterium]|nr:autotransporter-associated beta strand repeat-containing protein [Verrucomicrobiota bacterium]